MKTLYERYHKIIAAIISTGILISSIYAAYSYDVNNKIDKKQECLVEAVEFQTLVLLQTVPDSVYTRVVKIWKNTKSVIPAK